MTVHFEEPTIGKSKYEALFRSLHSKRNWGRWVVVDVVSGGGLASRLRDRGYRGMQDLDYEVKTNVLEDRRHKVFVRVHGQRKEEA